jgi:hypothetical protein
MVDVSRIVIWDSESRLRAMISGWKAVAMLYLLIVGPVSRGSSPFLRLQEQKNAETSLMKLRLGIVIS